MIMRRMCALVLGGVLILAGCQGGGSSNDHSAAGVADADTLWVYGAWARPGSAGGMSAVYAQIQNGTAAVDTLHAVTTPVANTVEVHESFENEDGTRGMRPAGPLPVPAGGQVKLEPGGFHVMLIRLSEAVQPGDSLTVDFQFARAGSRVVRAPVRMQPPE